MKQQLKMFFTTAALLFSASHAQATGFKFEQLDFPGTKALDVGIWYPSDTAPPDEPNTPFGLALAIDAPVSKPNGALIVISHGFSGWYAGHAKLAVALADAGFIVAAPSHMGNTWSDMSSSVDKWSVDRPAQISRVLDHLLNTDVLKSHINPEHVGIYGFSAGGYTALNLIGGRPDFNRATQACAANPTEFVCEKGWLDQMLDAGLADLPAESWGKDARIKAAAIAAPGFGFAYTSETLSEVTAPMQLWSAEFDHSVPAETNTEWLMAQLPSTPDYRVVKNANHFAFLLMPCREAFRQEDPQEYEVVCSDAEGFDRLAFHIQMRSEVIDFFNQHFGLQ